ncbi:MAG: DUF2892 domain-containing protein [Nannocystaceae bacterium]|nr:DUF2892 domain-containing protein [Nannocystaceae bacterium]
MNKLLPNNEHPIERVVRIVGGATLLALVFVGPQTPWGWLGLVLLATGLIGSCPLYTAFGLSTCPVTRHPKPS